MKTLTIFLICLMILGIGIGIINFVTAYNYQQEKHEGQSLIIRQWENGEITKQEAVEKIRELRENIAKKVCEETGCKIIRRVNG